MHALLILQDHTVIKGNGFGKEKTIFGELVFNTSMQGYQESLTDPSYKGQILMQTYPLIGNYGINENDFESNRIQAEGYVVREYCDFPSNKAKKTINEFLKEYEIPAIANVDTRMLTKKTREFGTLKAVLCTYENEIDISSLKENKLVDRKFFEKKKIEISDLIDIAKNTPSPDSSNLVEKVSTKKAIFYEQNSEISRENFLNYGKVVEDFYHENIMKKENFNKENFIKNDEIKKSLRKKIDNETFGKNAEVENLNKNFIKFNKLKNFQNRKKTIALIDFGVKRNILLQLIKKFNVIQLPYNISKEEIYSLNPNGILLTNGPGDPAQPELKNTVKNLSEFANDFPIFGICLGHQLIGLSFNGQTYKLKFGHRGQNQPVKNLKTNKVYITSQNHGFAVKKEIEELEITQLNVNDKTVEGLRHKEKKIFAVQYHPEASPGPRDTSWFFDEIERVCFDAKS